ncbi:PIR protein, putative [Plasmodium sp. gorilla clade G1]|nr:PIR protein, putative [Plasmodium sp. gorilla clade G1]
MKMYYLKMLLFTFLINTLVLPHYENYINNHYNISHIQNNTQRRTINSRLLAQTQSHNPHYHNDPELKEIIDQLNEEAIKKYQESHEPHEQLKELVEKKVTKMVSGHVVEPMSTIEKELLETYEEMFGDKIHIMLKSSTYINQDDKSCECANMKKLYNQLSSSNKEHDKYLDNLKTGCVGGVGVCTVSSSLVGHFGIGAASAAAKVIITEAYPATLAELTKTLALNFFSATSIESTITTATISSVEYMGAASAASTAFVPYIIPIVVPIAIASVLIILYIWLYRRRKNSWKHECKKYLCT